MLGSKHRPGPFDAAAVFVNRIQDRITDVDLEITVVAIQPLNPYLQVFVEFLAIVGFVHNRNIRDIERNCIGPVVPHGAQKFSVRKDFVPCKGNRANLHLGAFVDIEHQLDRVGRGNPFVGWLDRGELPAVFGQ